MESAYYAWVLDALPIRVFWKDRDGRYLGCNHQFAADAGFSEPSELVGRTDYDFYPSDQAAAFRADDRVVIDSGRQKLAIEEPLTRPSGETIWLETNKAPLRDGDGEIIGVIGAYREITERVRASEERQKLIDELTTTRDAALQANISKTLFVANMSHELRTPLNAIIGYSELILEEVDGAVSPTIVEDVRRIGVAADHLLKVINDVLDISKISAGRAVPSREVLSPSAAISEVMESLTATARANKTVLRWASPPAESMWTWGDATKFRQCVFNLLSNACKFTANGVVEVALRFGDECDVFVVEIADTGIGISEKQMERLFQPFSQADDSVSRRYQGTGLGLAITRSLAQLMGGDVSVRSSLGEGSTFTLRLPFERVAETPDFTLSRADSPPCGRAQFCTVLSRPMQMR